MSEKNNLDKYTGILFELKIGLNKDNARYVQGLLSNDYFRVYTGTDIIGAEIGGSVKNVIAIAAGICSGLELGDNITAALISRSLGEIKRFGHFFKASNETEV